MPVWPWLVIIGLGAFHGLNPAMGWLFAVALGLHRHSRRAVLLAIVPIGLGHALAIATVVALVLVAGVVLDGRTIRLGGAALLAGWALYHAVYGHRGRVRFGMQVGLVGLFVWSFLMATAHGAGLMLIPALIPLCLSASPAAELTASGSVAIGLAVVALHTLAMLVVTGAVAVAVYEWVGVGVLRRGWVNLDLVWTIALFAAAAALVVL
jgi:hypothetical protein